MKPHDTGLYLLILALRRGRVIKAGKLPENYFKSGCYLYVGRAKNSLRKRIERHLRKRKKRFWHIDYLLAKAELREVWVKAGLFDECGMARRLRRYLKSSTLSPKKFGASDCRCPGHLVYVPDEGELSTLRKHLGFVKLKT